MKPRKPCRYSPSPVIFYSHSFPMDPSPPASGGPHPSTSVRARSSASLSSAVPSPGRSLSSAASDDELILWHPEEDRGGD
ncbi:hypothetical protein V495_03065 [Pseudogymnoascus sp. VKM F-4514 (FW-929)]|nr:hypothetical protein V495_03065 [Pseudogymnoascus sp. VKM F-4514 (FW-929)]KFY60063.1 hypothetical protein V497_03893 [Pseudogymnoascus sp. VKM F-4516 (FW-969)]